MTMRARSSSRFLGPLTIAALVVALAVLWLVERPASERQLGAYLGQLVGAESILLMSVAIVLISTLPWVEVWFDGIDRAAIWHRRVAITGLLLLIPHILLSSGGRGPWWSGPAGVVATVGLVALVFWAVLPRWRTILPAPARRLVSAAHDWPPARVLARLLNNYEHWRALHRTTGIFVALAFAHALTDATPFGASPLLRWTFVAIGGVGLAFYAYRELLARRGAGLRDYQVRDVRPVGPGLTELVLAPLGRPLTFVPGQFATLHLEAKDGWHRHPFTIASAPTENTLRFTVKALGDFTTNIATLVRPGMPAVISGPRGRFTHEKGTARQVWIAGGVGITPFLSWLRSFDEQPPHAQVEFYYSVSDEAPYADEIVQIAERHANLSFHLVRTSTKGHLTAGQALAPFGGAGPDMSVFMCGPETMLKTLQVGLRQAGLPSRRIHREHFDWR